MTNGGNGFGGASDTPTLRTMLDAWRACGADRINPARFRFIDALERRAASLEGDVRRVLDERLAALVAEYSGEVERTDANADFRADARTDAGADADAANREPSRNVSATNSPPTQHASPRGALSELVDVLTSRATARAEKEASIARDLLHPHAHHRDRSPDLPVLDYFRETWSRFSTQMQLRQSREQVPDNAGPLNSNSLIHRSLSLMRELSPGYLQQFLSYAEALSWMEQLAGPVAGAGPAVAPAAEMPRTGSSKKGARGKPKAR